MKGARDSSSDDDVDELTVTIEKPSKTKAGKNEVPPYKRIKRLGSGGFADVFLVKDEEGFQFAMKVPSSSVMENLEDKQVKRFLQEATNWSKIYNQVKEGVVGIYTFGEDPRLHIIMEYMDDRNLRSRLKSMDMDEKLECLYSIMDTFHTVHHLGVIHRDIKPENILYNSRGEWKVADWGLSKVLIDSSMSSTEAGTIKATIAYAAPEQIDPDKFGKVDWRTDIYQLGALAYEMFTGKKMFEGDISNVMFSIMSKEAVSPRDIDPRIPDHISAAIIKAVSKKKKDRFQGALEFKKALEEPVVTGRGKRKGHEKSLEEIEDDNTVPISDILEEDKKERTEKPRKRPEERTGHREEQRPREREERKRPPDKGGSTERKARQPSRRSGGTDLKQMKFAGKDLKQAENMSLLSAVLGGASVVLLGIDFISTMFIFTCCILIIEPFAFICATAGIIAGSGALRKGTSKNKPWAVIGITLSALYYLGLMGLGLLFILFLSMI